MLGVDHAQHIFQKADIRQILFSDNGQIKIKGQISDAVRVHIMPQNFGVAKRKLSVAGGKGIAATAGLVLSVNWIMAICGIITFFTTFFVTHYVSLGSLLVYVGIVIEVIVLGQNGFFHMTQPHLYELYAVAIFLAVLAFWKHRENIKRLLSGTERKTYLSSKNKKK